MKTLTIATFVGAIGLSERIVDVLQPVAYLLVIVAIAVACWVLLAMHRADRAERDAAQRRADLEFARSHKVAR